MTLFRATGGTHVEDDKLWTGNPSVIDSEYPLDEMFPGKFTEVGDGVQASAFVPSPDPSAPIRRTSASEAQNLQKPQKGHDVPMGGSAPLTEFDEENATAAENPTREKELEEMASAEGFYDPEFEQPQIGSDLVAASRASIGNGTKRKGKASKAQPAKAQASSQETDPEGEDEDGASDVTDDFPEAGEIGYSVEKEGKTYYVLNENGNKVGDREGYTTKGAVKEELKKRAGK